MARINLHYRVINCRKGTREEGHLVSCCFDIKLYQQLMQLSVFGGIEVLLLSKNMTLLLDFLLAETWCLTHQICCTMTFDPSNHSVSI